MEGRIIIIDGNSLINRAYYAMQNPMMTKDGIYTQAIYGFINMLSKIEKEYEPGYIAVAWDLKAPTFRHKEYEEYKAGRRKMPMELAMQIPLMQEILEAKNIMNLSMEGYEADDIIGTLAKESEKKGLKPLIITGDKDALQLTSDTIQVLITKRGISEFDLYDSEKMMERYGLTPDQFIDLKGLMGDQSDNIPGIPGVGEKTGIELLKTFGNIESLLERTDEISKPKLREKVETFANQARMSRRLAEIITNVPIEIDYENLKYREPDYHKLIDLYSKLEFNSFLKKINTGGSISQGQTSSSKEESSFEKSEINIEPKEKIYASNIDELSNIRIENKEDVFIKVFSDYSHINIPDIIGLCVLTKDYYCYVTGMEAIKEVVSLLNKNKVNDIYSLIMNDISLDEISVSFDSEIASYLVDPARSGYSLKALMMENFHVEMQDEKEFLKDLGQMDIFGTQDKEYMEYGFQSTSAVAKLKNVLIPELEEKDLNRVYYNVELPLVMVLASMEKEGFAVEEKELDSFGKKLKSEIESITKDIYESAKEEFNINSTQQLGEILFEKLGLTAGKKTKRGYSTSAEILERIQDEHPIVPLVLRYRMLTKLNSTYVDGLKPLIGFDGKIRAHFQQTVTATGRISCTEPNLQNIPIRNEYGRLLRKSFIPRDKEHILVGADYSQIELRVLAHLSEDESLIEAFNKGDDIHRATAARVFNIPYDEVTSLDRSKAKAVNFGVIYGMSGFGLSEELGITKKEAENYIKDYFEKHPKVKSYMDSQIAMAKKEGYTETIMGRRRYIPEIKSPAFMVRSLGERLAMNSPIQGSAADIIKIAMVKVWNELNNRNMESKLILQVHDELIIDTLKSELDDVKELLVRNMMEAMDLKVKLVSDLNTGNTWYDLK